MMANDCGEYMKFILLLSVSLLLLCCGKTPFELTRDAMHESGLRNRFDTNDGDRFEPNNTYGSARYMGSIRGNVSNEIEATIDYPKDRDFYECNYASGGIYYTTVTLDEHPCGYQFAFYDHTGSNVYDSMTSMVPPVRITFCIAATNYYRYVALIYGTGSSDATNSYHLRMITRVYETHEPNDDSSHAAYITVNEVITGTIDPPTDIDWYRLTVVSNSMTFSLSNIPAGCNYDLHLLDGNRAYVTGSMNAGNTEELFSSASLVKDASYFLVVSNAGISYSFSNAYAVYCRPGL